MSSFTIHEVAFNLVLFKRLRFYHIFDPNSARFYNHNIYRLIYVISTLFVIGINLYGLLGFIVKMEDTVEEIKLIQILFVHMHCFLSFIKMGVCIYNADKIWDLLDVTRTNFMKSIQCSKHMKILNEYQKSSIKITNFLYVLLKITVLLWMVFPLLFNIRSLMKTSRDCAQRYDNVFNFRFPVTINVYNYYFSFFYIIETTVLLVIAYSLLLIDTLLISIVYVLIAQYEILTLAFKYIGHDEQGLQHGKDINKY